MKELDNLIAAFKIKRKQQHTETIARLKLVRAEFKQKESSPLVNNSRSMDGQQSVRAVSFALFVLIKRSIQIQINIYDQKQI